MTEIVNNIICDLSKSITSGTHVLPKTERNALRKLGQVELS